MTDDEAEILRLDNEWNEAYRRADRAPLADILAEDFTGWTALNEPITKALLMINPPGGRPRMANFSEQLVRAFGDAGITRGRLRLEDDGRVVVDQRFLRVFAKRGGIWRAVSVAVTPVGA